MKDERSEILAQVGESLKSAILPSARAAIPPRQDGPRVDAAETVEQFVRELDALGVKVYRPSTATEARDIVVELVCAQGKGSQPDSSSDEESRRTALELLAWEDSEIPVEGLGDALRAAGIKRLDPIVPADPEGRRARLAELERASVGLTGAVAALADSGTLVLSSGPTRPRLASLLPPVHIAVVAQSTIYGTMADLFSNHPALVLEASNLVFITGPSRSADIEQTLTLGVHGPRQVHVVLV